MIFISDIGTKVNEEILQEWAEKLPGCRIFLENFFLTYRGYPPEVNYLNYIRDLKLYSPTNRHIRENFIYLIQAFYEVTELSEAQPKARFGVAPMDSCIGY